MQFFRLVGSKGSFCHGNLQSDLSIQSHVVAIFSSLLIALSIFLMTISGPHAQPNSSQDPCANPNVQNDARPISGGSTDIKIAFFLADLTQINDVHKTITGDFFVSMTWVDKRLVHLENCRLALAEIWTPDIVLENAGRLFTSLPRVASIAEGGVVNTVQRYFGTIASYHDLYDFPFDKQQFVITILPIDQHVDLKWSGKIGQRTKMYPTRMNGYANDDATELFRQV